MKAIFVLSAICVSVAAQADVFRRNTVLPHELQKRVLALVNAECGHGRTKIDSLYEEGTTVVVKKEDQGVHDRYFTTTLKAVWYFDQTHPASYWIEIRSAEYAISNPAVDRFEILGHSSEGDVCQ